MFGKAVKHPGNLRMNIEKAIRELQREEDEELARAEAAEKARLAQIAADIEAARRRKDEAEDALVEVESLEATMAFPSQEESTTGFGLASSLSPQAFESTANHPVHPLRHMFPGS